MPGGPPYIVALGGMDPTGGAGLVRDFVTADALGAVPLLVGTAWTAQSSRGVAGFAARPAREVEAEVERALGSAPRGRTAVKIGMAATAPLARAVAAALSGFEGPVVFDPVLAASSGGRLFEGEPDELLPLARRASLVTPNAREAAALAGGVVETVEEARGAGRRLVAAGAAAVLVKGGHLAGDAVDVLVMRGGSERAFAAPRAPGPAPRGTGCALATAIAVGLARGQDLPDAVAAAKAWLLDRIRAARPVGDERHL